jgi:two-component system NtrC family response regulator
MTKQRLLMVDDDEEIRSQMRWALASDYEIVLAEDRLSALAAFRTHHPAVVLLDLGLPPRPADPTEGIGTLTDLLAEDPKVKVIIISGQSERTNAIRAVGEGAYDFLAKPVEMAELKIILKRAFHVAQLERDLVEFQSQQRPDTFEGLLGTSQSMLDVFAAIRKVATTDASVLILGESGTGKEMAALAIHRRSVRKDAPFVAINCGAIPEALLESELFGHEKGAFTGAHAQRVGRIETASGGTLFLDEIGELPTALQVKLLRFLQEQRIERVGGRSSIQVDVRVVAATHVDLRQAMTVGKFREDLFYRLAVVVLKLPALRERGGDIALLAQAFLRKFASRDGHQNLQFDSATLRALERHQWPGNVRELENRVKRAMIMAEGHKSTPRDLELFEETTAPSLTLKDAREALERDMVQQALRRSGGKISAAAAELGVSRPTFYELMEKLGLKKEGV